MFVTANNKSNFQSNFVQIGTYPQILSTYQQGVNKFLDTQNLIFGFSKIRTLREVIHEYSRIE